MAYEVTATRKRPQAFDGLVGQEFVVSTLKNALGNGRIANAFLFAGPRGVGKTSAARILARALNCPSGPNGDGCDDFPGADEIAKGRSADVIEIDGASNTSVNDIRTIKDEILFPPQSSRFKIYIIDEVHMLSNAAFNALLKTIEEPPAYVKFIFATTEIHKVPATIRSRCQQFNFRLISIDLIKEKLAEACTDLGVKADDEALFWIAKEGTGSLRDSYTLLDQVLAFSGDQVTLEKIREKLGFVGFEQLALLANAAFQGNAQETLEQLDAILQAGISVEQCIIDCAEYYRALLFVQAGIRRESLLGASPDRFATEVVKGYTRGQLERILALFLQLYRDIRYSLDPRTELELAVARLSRARLSLDSQEILAKFEALEDHYIRASHAEPAVTSSLPPPQTPSVRPQAKLAVPVPQAGPVAAVPAPQPSVGQAVEQAKIDQFMKLVAKDRPLLVGTLEHVDSWQLSENRLHLVFDAHFAHQRAKEEAEVISQAAKALWPTIEGIELSETAASVTVETTTDLDPAVRLATEIFRGEVVTQTEPSEDAP